MFEICWPDRVSQDRLVNGVSWNVLSCSFNEPPAKRPNEACCVCQNSSPAWPPWPVMLPRHLRVGLHGDRPKESIELNRPGGTKDRRVWEKKATIDFKRTCPSLYRGRRARWLNEGFETVFICLSKKDLSSQVNIYRQYFFNIHTKSCSSSLFTQTCGVCTHKLHLSAFASISFECWSHYPVN